MKKLVCAAALVACSNPLLAEQKADTLTEEMFVTGVRNRLYQSGMLKDVIQKTEVISSEAISQANAVNLSQALDDAPGVRINNECSMCGVKRVMLNGLRGEHTTILVDGIPSYTMMSGFYGLDAASTAGIERIEIARGAGASMIAPEAIGGTINLISKTAQSNNLEVDLSAGELGNKKASAVVTAVANHSKTRLTVSGQYDSRDIYDGDHNHVGENPELLNQSATLFLSQDFSAVDNLNIRFNHTESEIFGGPTGTGIDRVKEEYFSDPEWESENLFINGDVRNEFIGRSWETTEWIASTRTEFYASWLREFNSTVNLSISGSYNKHEQDSFYEGFIYQAENPMKYLDARLNTALGQHHLFTFGIDKRSEELRSQSNSNSDAYVSDSFNYDTLGVYLQDTWNMSAELEIAAALRIDKVRADFIDPQKPGVEIDETLLSPRADIRWLHNDWFTSRFSVGRGYRAPLSFFESDHGILDGDLGFDIQIDRLERSLSGNYALSYDGVKTSLTTSLAHTQIENLATLNENEQGVPVLGQSQDSASVLVADLALSYAATDKLTLSSTLESMQYSDEFKQAFGVVPAEERLIVSADWAAYGWDIFIVATWIGGRDLREYATPENPTFDQAGEHPKNQTVSAYWTMDFRVEKTFFNRLHVYGGARNLLDYTQVNNMETPLFYEGGSYDVAHIYGPLRGREAYLGVKYHF